MTGQPHASAIRVPRAAAWLGAAGLIPFAAGAAALWILPPEHLARAADVLVGYAVVILSFMGAVHWGLAMAAGPNRAGARWFVLGVVPALAGWCALMLAPVVALGLLGLAFIGVYGLDRAAIRAGLAPAWYRRLRDPLTAGVVALLVVGGAAAWVRLP